MNKNEILKLKEKMEKYIAFIDGGKEPGTGVTLLGGIVYRDDGEVFRYSEKGPTGKNADAEFLSLIKCLELSYEKGIREISINCDASILVDSLKDNTTKLEEMINKLFFCEGDAKIGLAKALSKITGQKFEATAVAWKKWFNKNRNNLDKADMVSTKHKKYIQKLKELQMNISFTLQLIPRSENCLADRLCKKARSK